MRNISSKDQQNFEDAEAILEELWEVFWQSQVLGIPLK